MIGVLLVILSVLGAFETPTVQACIPQMLTGDGIIRGNAVVNSTASVAYLTAPFLGGTLYAAIGLKPVMHTSVGCFLTTALLECFIKLDGRPGKYQGKLLFLAALSRFFVMGVTLVGLPFLIRTVLKLGAAYYGGAESSLAVATILGSIAAGLLTEKLKSERMSLMLAAIGACMIPAGAVFLFPSGLAVRYSVNVAAFCGIQAAISIFSIFAVSLIQQKTPGHLIGKVMAYTSAITTCAQPAGQMVYGIWFDRFKDAVYLVLIPTGITVCLIGLSAAGFFRKHNTYFTKNW